MNKKTSQRRIGLKLRRMMNYISCCTDHGLAPPHPFFAARGERKTNKTYKQKANGEVVEGVQEHHRRTDYSLVFE